MSSYDTLPAIQVNSLISSLSTMNSDDMWDLVPHPGLVSIIQERIKLINYHERFFITGSKVHWSGILTAEPFNDLFANYDSEEDILNTIKDHNLKVSSTPDGIVVSFYYNSESPLATFFSQYGPGGYGGNIPHSIAGLINNIERYLQDDILENPEVYGTWNMALNV